MRFKNLVLPCRSYPGGAAPELFARTTLVGLEPVAAEDILEADEGGSHQPADGMSAVLVQPETPAVEEQGTEYGLSEIVRKTHLAVRGNLQEEVMGLGTVEEKHDAGNDYQHHCEVLPHIEEHVKCAVHSCDSCRAREEFIQRDENHQGA